MGFSNDWDQAYRNNQQMSIWPWTDLVSYVMRDVSPSGPNFRVLELGCGAGANIPFFKSLGVKYFGIDGSITIIKKLNEKFPDLKNNLICTDFTKEIPFKEKFDLIVDRASITSNTKSAIEKSIKLIYIHLKPAGKFIGIDWYSTQYTEYNRGDNVPNDPYSKKNFKDGNFQGLGIVHFSDKDHILKLFNKFDIEIMEHKIIKTEIPNTDFIFASWNFIAIKKD